MGGIGSGRKAEDLTGRRYGVVIAIRHDRGDWICRCDCGGEIRIRPDRLKLGRFTCRCRSAHRNVIGEMTLEYKRYRAMIQRCEDSNHPSWKYYGARGIVVCERWRKSFTAFLEDMGAVPLGKTLDRIDNDKGYEPSNCRWATPKEQIANRRAG